MRPDLGRRLAAGRRSRAGAARRAIRRRVRHHRRPVGARRADARGAGAGRRAADAARRRLAHRAAGRRPPRPRRDRRRHRRALWRRLRGRSDRRASRPDRARQHGRLSDLAARTAAPPMRTATASPTSAPTASAMPTPPSSSRICCAPCAHGASPACSSKMIRIGCRLALPSKPIMPEQPREAMKIAAAVARRSPARVSSGLGAIGRGVLQVPSRHHHGRLQRRQHLRHRDAHGGAAHRQAHSGKSDRHSGQPAGRRQSRRGKPGVQCFAARRHRDRRLQPQHPDRTPARLSAAAKFDATNSPGSAMSATRSASASPAGRPARRPGTT